MAVLFLPPLDVGIMSVVNGKRRRWIQSTVKLWPGHGH